jgi:uncharacterized protein (DUF2147 family)
MRIRTRAITSTILSVLLCAATALGATGDDILGVWNNQEKDAKIEILKCGEKYCGRIVWLKEPNYPEGSKDGTPGSPRVDRHNPRPELRTTPTIGLRIANDFTYAGGNRWADGTVYDPKNGKTYSGKMTLASPNQLDLRGFIGISLLGRTTSWTR